MPQISINLKKCAGCGFCAGQLPNIFKLDIKNLKTKLEQKNKIVDSLSLNLSQNQLRKITEIIKNCPTQAITIIK